MRQVVLSVALALVASSAIAWWKDCSVGGCWSLQWLDIRPAGFSDGVSLLVEVGPTGEAKVTALVARRYHERFYTTRPATYIERDGRELVPAYDFFNDCCAATLFVDGDEVAKLKVEGLPRDTQLRSRDSGERIADTFRAGSRASLMYSTLMEGKGQVTSFSLMGFSATRAGIKPPTPKKAVSNAPPATVVARELGENRFGVLRQHLLTKENRKGAGSYVYVEKTRFEGTERLFIWFVRGDKAVKLNGATNNLTPGLPFPLDAHPDVWEGTGLNASTVTRHGLATVFGR